MEAGSEAYVVSVVVTILDSKKSCPHMACTTTTHIFLVENLCQPYLTMVAWEENGGPLQPQTYLINTQMSFIGLMQPGSENVSLTPQQTHLLLFLDALILNGKYSLMAFD